MYIAPIVVVSSESPCLNRKAGNPNVRKRVEMHKWKYRNPSDRTCEICGRRENEMVFAIEGQNFMYKGKTWWEEVYPLSNIACTGRFAAWLRGVQRLLGSRQ